MRHLQPQKALGLLVMLLVLAAGWATGGMCSSIRRRPQSGEEHLGLSSVGMAPGCIGVGGMTAGKWPGEPFPGTVATIRLAKGDPRYRLVCNVSG